ncbi:MAG: FxLYD domain-containing protein [Candidatus Nitrosocosmicus sp.]
MKSLSSPKIFGIVLLVLTGMIVIIEGNSLHSEAFSQEININKKYDIVLLSHTYNSERLFADKITGEILNNGTATIKAVRMTAIVYDDEDDIIGTERSGTSPYTINPGDKATFTIEIYDEPIKSAASSYDFTVKWKDEYLFSSYFTSFAGDEISDDDGSGENDDF